MLFQGQMKDCAFWFDFFQNQKSYALCLRTLSTKFAQNSELLHWHTAEPCGTVVGDSSADAEAPYYDGVPKTVWLLAPIIDSWHQLLAGPLTPDPGKVIWFWSEKAWEKLVKGRCLLILSSNSWISGILYPCLLKSILSQTSTRMWCPNGQFEVGRNFLSLESGLNLSRQILIWDIPR